MKYVIFLVIFSISISCKTSSSDLNIFFNKIDKNLTQIEKQKLINCDSIDCIVSFALLSTNTKFKELFNTDLSKNVITQSKSKYPHISLIRAYQKTLNNESYSFVDINIEIQKYFEKQKSIKKLSVIKNRKRKKNIAKLNYYKYNKTDTICLVFPLSNRDGKCIIDYKLPNQKDNLFYLTASVLGKEIITQKDDFDNEEQFYYFNLEVVKLSKENCFFMLDSLKERDRIRLEISHYGRKIGNGTD